MGQKNVMPTRRAIITAKTFLGLPISTDDTIASQNIEYVTLAAEWEGVTVDSERDHEIIGRLKELISECSDPEELLARWDVTYSSSLKRLIEERIVEIVAAVRPEKEVPNWAILLLRQGMKNQGERHFFLNLPLAALAKEILAAAKTKN